MGLVLFTACLVALATLVSPGHAQSAITTITTQTDITTLSSTVATSITSTIIQTDVTQVTSTVLNTETVTSNASTINTVMQTTTLPVTITETETSTSNTTLTGSATAAAPAGTTTVIYSVPTTYTEYTDAYTNGYPYYYNPQYVTTQGITQTDYVTQVSQSWQTQTITQQQTEYYTAFFTARANAFGTGSFSDPLTMLGLIGGGASIVLAFVGIAWALQKRPHR